jgi:hypothetical protein
VNAVACAFVAGIGQDRQVLEVRLQHRQQMLAGGGDVMNAARQDAGDPQRDRYR